MITRYLNAIVPLPSETRPSGKRPLLSWMRRAWAVHAERRALAALDDRQMRDTGITEDARRAELTRPFWNFD